MPDTSPTLHAVVQITRMTALGSGINPPGTTDAGRVFLGPDDQAGITIELDSLEAARRLLDRVQHVVDLLELRATPAAFDELAGLRPALRLAGRWS